jgi:glycosyltransferase involved in cell wall biosynthesis
MSEPAPAAAALVICSKSAWDPAIRREHSLALLAADHGHPVTFIERAIDVRAFRRAGGVRAFARGLRGAPGAPSDPAAVSVIAQSTILPGHLNTPAELSGNLLLRRLLRRVPAEAATVVNVPWQWPATAHLQGRRVFDCADDWSALMPHRSSRLSALYERIGLEADAVVLASPSLADRFPADRTVVVPNGVSEDMLGPLSRPVDAGRLVHAGTLTPRFDADLAARLLELLPDWTLDLYGQCQYPGSQEAPGPELARLLADHAPRVRWHGVVARGSLSAAIDRASVALVLNRPERSSGQDSMKLYDYAARGRPIVSTRFSPDLERTGPPHLRLLDDPSEMAQAILACSQEPASWAQDRRRWAEHQRWGSRWPAWSRAVFGTGQ